MNEEKKTKPRKTTPSKTLQKSSIHKEQNNTDIGNTQSTDQPQTLQKATTAQDDTIHEKKASRTTRKTSTKEKPTTSQKRTRSIKKTQVEEESISLTEPTMQISPSLQNIDVKKSTKRASKKPIPSTNLEDNTLSYDNIESQVSLEDQLKDVAKPRRGRPKRSQAPVNEKHDIQQNLQEETQEHVEPIDISAQNTQSVREVTSQRRKAGRPPKNSSRSSITMLSKTENTKDHTLAITQTPRLSITEEKRLALAQSQKIALESNQKMILDASQNLELVEHIPSENEHPLLLSQSYPQNKHNAHKNIQKDSVSNSQNMSELIENKSTDFSSPKGRNQKKSRTSKKTRQQKKSADFIVGEYGTSHNIDPQNQYSEQAALGVMGIIDEAPHVDALLPLVLDTPEIKNDSDLVTHSIDELYHLEDLNSVHELEKTPSKKSRRSRRNRKTDSRTQKQDQELQHTQNSDFYLEADSAPIAEGDELSLLEAEESIKKAGKSGKGKTLKEQLNRVLYVSCVPDEQVEVVITENGVVSEYFIEMEHQAKIRGNIYKGVINNVDTNLQAAFVNFGGGKNGFLQIDEVHPEYWLTPQHSEDGKIEGGGKYPPIQKVLKVGQEVLVQVVKEPAGSKGAFLTTWISLAGRFIVLTPGQEQIGVSRKVEDNAERTRLRELLAGIKPGEDMGVIIRTASEGASKANIQNDLKFLKRIWKDVQKKVQTATAPSLIHQEADLPSRAVRDYLTSDISEVWVDSEEVRESLQDLIAVVFPRNKNILKLHKDTRSTLWERFNILRQLDEVTKREVVLPSGGRLVFDQTEALMAIDINSGKTHGKINFEAMVFRTNMEAVEAIARHLRLRDIGGQVVIDFIEMRDRGHCREVEKAMRTAMKRDRARHDVGRLSSFGLLELVRQRTGTSAISISSEPCPHCRGTGFRRNLEWQAQGVLRDIKSKLSSGKNMPSTYVHHVDHEVAFYLLNKKRDRLSELEDMFTLKIEIHAK